MEEDMKWFEYKFHLDEILVYRKIALEKIKNNKEFYKIITE